MCTLTYLPKGKAEFILTSNRDEGAQRPLAIAPAYYSHGAHHLLYPKDAAANGTWLATSSNAFTLCLLNGAFEKHHHQPPYRRSRGLVLLDFFDYSHIEQFAAEYDFSGIEPFTLVIFSHQDETKVHEIRWDGKIIHPKQLNHEVPLIWSSATLYEPQVRQAREQWYAEWLKENPNPQPHDLLNFHRFGGSGDRKNDLLMNRENKVFTVSISGIARLRDARKFYYQDLVLQEEKLVNIQF